MVRLASCLYALLMRLYPHGFRARFGAEMRGVFEDVVAGAAERGSASLVGVCVRELWDLVRVPLDEHRYQHRKKENKQMTKRVDLSTGWTLWLHWVLASVVGAYLGSAVGALAVLVVAKVVGGGAEDRVPTEIMLGAGIGVAQWLVLRRHVPKARRWVLASVSGAVVFSVWNRPLMLAVYSITDSILEIRAFVGAVALGAFLGIGQWLVLRRHVSRSGWWLVASVGGYGIATSAAGKGVSSIGEVIAYLVVPPAITGLALVWILRHPRPETLDPAQRSHRTAIRRFGDTTDFRYNDPSPTSSPCRTASASSPRVWRS